jgi:hypothetical protein
MSSGILNEAVKFSVNAEAEVQRIAALTTAADLDKVIDTRIQIKQEIESSRKKFTRLTQDPDANPSEIARLAEQLKGLYKKETDLAEKQRNMTRERDKETARLRREIEHFYTRGRAGTEAFGKTRVVSYQDVVAFKLGRKIYKSGIFYFDPEMDNFIQIVADQLGAPEDEEDQEQAALTVDDQKAREQAAKEKEDEEREDELEDDEEQEAAQEIGRSEVLALRKSRGALVSKTVTMSNGETRQIPMPPLARYYHLLPPAALAENIKKRWKSEGADKIHDITKRELASDELKQALDEQLKKFADTLRVETCLIDAEINQIYRVFLRKMPAILRMPLDQQKRAIESTMSGVIDDVIINGVPLQDGNRLKRSIKSNFIGYIKRKDKRIITPDELIAIDSGSARSGGLGISLNQIGKMGRQFEKFLTSRYLKIQRTEELRDSLQGEHEGAIERSIDLLSPASAVEQMSAKFAVETNREFAPDSFKGTALSGDPVEEEMIDQIEDSKAKTEPFETANLASSHVPIRVAVRPGETIDTLYNRTSDEEDLVRATKAPIKKPLTHPQAIMPEIDAVASRLQLLVTRIRSGIDKFVKRETSDSPLIDLCRSARDEITYLSGLLEYFAMYSAIQEGRILVATSRSMQESALEITDIIVSMSNIERKKVTTSSIDLAIAEKRSLIASASPKTKPTFERELRRLIEQRDQITNGIAANSSEVVDLVTNINESSFVNGCQKYLASLAEVEKDRSPDEQKTDAERKSSRLSLAFAALRKERMKTIEARQLRSWSSAQLRVMSASDIYEQRVQNRTAALLHRNKFQMHALQKNETINGLISLYRMDEAFPELSSGSLINAALPAQYVGAGLTHPIAYTIDNIKREKGKTFYEIVSKETMKDGRQLRVTVSKEVLQRAAFGKTTKTKEQLRKEFADLLRYSAYSAIRSIARTLSDTATAQIESSRFLERPLIPQMAEILRESDQKECREQIEKGVEILASVMSDANLKDFSPDPRNATPLSNSRIERAFSLIVEISRRVNLEYVFLSTLSKISEGDSVLQEQYNRVDRPSSDEIKQRADEFMNTLERESDAAAFVRSAAEALAVCLAGKQTERKISEFFSKGTYEDRLTGLMIPVPAAPILTPGNILTVVPPRRTLGSEAREVMRSSLFGINANIMISQPVLGILRTIVLATTAHALLPVMRLAARELSPKFAERVWSAVGPRRTTIGGSQVTPGMTEGERDEVEKICEQQILSIFVNPLVRGEDDLDTATKMLEAYKRSAAAVRSERVSSIKLDESDSGTLEADVADAAIMLKRELVDGAYNALLTREAAAELYAVSPCLAVLLNPSYFTEKQRALFNVLVPPSDQALEKMTASLFDEIMGAGIQKGKEFKLGEEEIFISDSADRVAAAVKIINDFYQELTSEANALGAGRAVLSRVAKRLKLKGTSDSENVSAIASALGVKATTEQQLIQQADRMFAQIVDEMTELGNANSSSPIFLVVSRLVAARAGNNPVNICQNLGAQNQYKLYLEKTQEFIDSVDVIQTQDASEAPMRFSAEQLVHEIAGRAYNALISKYRSDSEFAVKRRT